MPVSITDRRVYTWAAAGSQWKSRFAVDHLARLRFRVGSRVAATFGLQCTPTAEPWLTLCLVAFHAHRALHTHYTSPLSFEKIAIPIRSFASSLFIPMPATRSRGCQRSRSLLTNEQIRLLFKVYGQCVYLLFSSAKENRVTVRPNDWSTECFLFFFFFFFLLFSSFEWRGITHVDRARNSKYFTETFLFFLGTLE